MLHGVFDLWFDEFVVAQCVRFLRLQFLYFPFLSFEDLIEAERLTLEPLDLRLESSDVVIVTELARCFNCLVAQIDELFLYFCHVALVSSLEVLLVILEHPVELRINLINQVIKRFDSPQIVIFSLILGILEIGKERPLVILFLSHF